MKKFSHKVEDGLLKFHYRQALYPIQPYRLFKLLGPMRPKPIGRRKFEAMFREFKPDGACEFILFFKREFIYLLHKLMENCPFALRRQYQETVDSFLYVLENIKEPTRPYKLDRKKMSEDCKFDAMKHQLQAFQEYENVMTDPNVRGMLLDAAPGTGKTFMSLAMSRGMEIRNVLIICPLATVENVWVSSLNGEKQVFKFPIRPYLINNKKCEDYKPFESSDRSKSINYIITNYERLDIVYKNLSRLYIGRDTLVIVDESHNFGDPKSNRTIFLKDLVNKIDPSNILLLSGTPVKSRSREILNIANLLNRNYTKYEKNIEKLYGKFGSFDFVLRDEYKKTSTNIVKDDIKLPDIHYKKIKVNLGSKGKQFTLTAIGEELREFTEKRLKELKGEFHLYRKAHLDYVNRYYVGADIDKENYLKTIEKMQKMTDSQKLSDVEMLRFCKDIEQRIYNNIGNKVGKDHFKETCSIVKFINFKVRGEALGQLFVRRKIDCYTEVIKKLDLKNVINEAEKKTVIFSSYIENCEHMVKNVIDSGFIPMCVFGESSKNLAQNVSKFNDYESDYNPLVTTYASLSTGVELKTANTMVLIDLPYRAAEFEQTIARIHRQGQDADCYVYIIDLDTGEEKNICQRTVDIIKYYDEKVMYLTGHGTYQDLTNLNYGDEANSGSYIDAIKFENDMHSNVKMISSYDVDKLDILKPITYLKSKMETLRVECDSPRVIGLSNFLTIF